MKNKNDQTLETTLHKLKEKIKNQKYAISEQLRGYKEAILISVARGQEAVNPFQKTENELLLREVFQQLNQYAEIALNNQKTLIKAEKERSISTPSSLKKTIKDHLAQLKFDLSVMKNTFNDCKKNNKKAFELLDDLIGRYDEVKKQLDKQLSRNKRDATSTAALTNPHCSYHLYNYMKLDADQQLANAGKRL